MLNPEFDRSRIGRAFEASLDDRAIKCVSFDVFDTLLRRETRTPQEVFVRVADSLIAEGLALPVEPNEYRLMRREAEALAQTRKTRQDIRFADIFACLPFADALKRKLLDRELRIERQVARRDEFCGHLLEKARAHGKALLFISDMYHSRDFIAQLILDATGIDVGGNLYVSSEYGLTKATGDLFREVMRQTGFAAHEILHVGDNYAGDVLAARGCGMAAIHFNIEAYERTALERELAQGVVLPAQVQRTRIDAALRAPDEPDRALRFFYSYGALFLGPALTAFAKWIIESCVRQGLDLLLCHMREGEIVGACLQRELDRRPDVKLRLKLCYSSRQSTFWPSLTGLSRQAVLERLTGRRFYTFGDLKAEVGLDIQHWPSEQRLTDFRDDPAHHDMQKLQAFFSQNWPVIAAYIERSKQDLDAYINDLTEGAQAYATVEYSGSGTTQHQLNRALTRPADFNYLFFANHAAYERATDMAFSSFLPLTDTTRKAIDLLTRSGEVMDAILTGTGGTTLGYAKGEDGRVRPVLAGDTLPAGQARQVLAFEQGVEAYHRLSVTRDIAAPGCEDRLAMAGLMARLLANPVADEARYIGDMKYVDNYGASYDLVSEEAVQCVAEAGLPAFWRAFSNNISHEKQHVVWPGGAMACLDANFIPDMNLYRAGIRKFEEPIARLVNRLREDAVRRVIVYGAGEFFSLLLPELEGLGVEIVAVVDSKAKHGAYKVGNFWVQSIDQIEKPEGVAVVISSASFISAITRTIEAAYGDRGALIYAI